MKTDKIDKGEGMRKAQWLSFVALVASWTLFLWVLSIDSLENLGLVLISYSATGGMAISSSLLFSSLISRGRILQWHVSKTKTSNICWAYWQVAILAYLAIILPFVLIDLASKYGWMILLWGLCALVMIAAMAGAACLVEIFGRRAGGWLLAVAVIAIGTCFFLWPVVMLLALGIVSVAAVFLLGVLWAAKKLPNTAIATVAMEWKGRLCPPLT